MGAAARRDTDTVSDNSPGEWRAKVSTTDAVVILVMLATHMRSKWREPANTAPLWPSATTQASALTNGVSTLRDTLAQPADMDDDDEDEDEGSDGEDDDDDSVKADDGARDTLDHDNSTS